MLNLRRVVLQPKPSACREAEEQRLLYLKTAHLYTVVTIVNWSALIGHNGYDVIDREKLERVHKLGEGMDKQESFSNIRILKDLPLSHLIKQHDEVMSK